MPGFWRSRYLPIEAFRDAASGLSLHGTADVTQVFRSSGTSGETRALVRFSRAGLQTYRNRSVQAFLDVLATVAARAPRDLLGLSLIPPVNTWPESSLAQMVAWIAEVVPVRYVTAATLAGEVHARAGQPVWLFATAFHCVDLLDGGHGLALPDGSVVIETGGTKGKTRAVTRASLYREISAELAVPEARIVSEYGMCELATQAYDFVRPGATGPRAFRFPSDVKVRVVTGPDAVHRAGRGALLVDDPGRIDAPWPLRTEDLVELEEDGSFLLQGRIPSAPLKGCSLLAEGESPAAHPAPEARQAASKKPAASSQKRDGIGNAATVVRTLLGEPAFADALADEIGSRAAAHAAVEDLRASMPKSPAEWASAVTVATDRGTAPHRWLFILPESHSLAGMYPLALAAAAGIDVTVRIPRRFAAPGSALCLWVEALAQAGASVAAADELKRIVDDCHGFDAILAYGDDATLATIRDVAGVPVQGFGERFGISVLDGRSLAADAAAAVRDAFSLGQRGCMATRIAVLIDDGTLSPATAAATLADAARAFWGGPLPATARIALDLERWHRARAGFALAGGDATTPLVAVRRIETSAALAAERLAAALATRQLTLPVLVVTEKNSRAFVKTVLTPELDRLPLASVTLAPALTKYGYHGLSFRVLGAGNAPVWDGRHERRALFGLRPS